MILDKSRANISTSIIGGKSDNLIWLEKNSFPTPVFEVILVSNYIPNFSKILESLIKELKGNNQANIDKIFSCLDWNFDKIEGEFSRLQPSFQKKVSFRTSASLEDLAEHSFAGLYETYLEISFTEENFLIYIKKCFRSVFSDRVFQYLKSNDIGISELNFSIIIQEMYPAKFSGVAFCQYPLNAKIVFGEGLGKNVVDGNNAHEIDIPAAKGKLETPSIIRQNNLDQSFQKLLSAIERITYLKGAGQDIEWSVSEHGAAILQTRDITKDITANTQEEIFDCTNISESYPSVVSPLTYSFIQFAYSKVYANFFRLVGVKNEKINKKQETLNNLLGYIKGRVYYKISNWYKMIEILPGYSYNKEFFESMLVPQKKLPRVARKKTNVQLFFLLKNAPLILKFTRKLLFYNNLNKKFLTDFESKLIGHKKMNLQAMNANELCHYYTNLKEDFLDDWKVPILNDFRLMIFHGILKKIVFKNIKNDPQIHLNKIIANFSNNDDLELIQELNKLSLHIQKKQALARLFQESDAKFIYSQLLDNDNAELAQFKSMLDAYIQRFGDRRPDELMLESPRISDNPEMLINLIKHYSTAKYINERIKKPNSLIGELETAIKNKNGMVWGSVYDLFARWIAHYTRLSIRFRELFRIKRAYVYGIARDCFLALAQKFVSAKIINEKEDIFYLTTNEIISIANNNSLESNYVKIIESRKETFNKYKKDKNPPQRLKVFGIGNKAQIIGDAESFSTKYKYHGLPTSQGVVRGRAVVMKKFDAQIDLRDKIVVTYQTDPGWSLIFPLIKGIVLEKGNSLSHAAILSRELGIPSVVRVEEAVEKIKNNDLLEVDGNKGIIKIINQDEN